MEIATEKVKNENNTNIKHQTLKLLKQFGRRCDNDDSTEPARQRHHLTAAVAAVECCRFEDRGRDESNANTRQSRRWSDSVV